MSNQATKVALPYRPRPFFVPFHNRQQRFSLIVAHRSCGKTEAALNELLWRALKTKKPFARYAYIGPTYVQAINVAWERLKRGLPQALFERCSVKESNHTITFPNGVCIQVFGADKYDSLRGLRLDGLILDEVADMHPDAWPLVILPCLTQQIGQDGWAVFIGTPKGTSNFFYQQREKARADTRGEWFYLELPVSTTKFLSQDVLDAARREMDEDEYLQEYECNFYAANKGSYYGKLINEAEAEGRILPLKFVKAAPVHVAFDLGWSDETTGWFYQLVNGRLKVLHYYHTSGSAVADIVFDVKAIAKERGFKLVDWWLPHDANKTELGTGKTIIEQFRREGVNPRPVRELGFQQGIQAARKTIPMCEFDSEHCSDGLAALKEYRKKWNDKLGTYSNTHVHNWASHGADGFRYLSIAVREYDVELSVPQRALLTPLGPSVSGLPTTAINIDVSGITQQEFEWLESTLHVDDYQRI